MSQVDPYAELRAGVRSVVTQFDSRYWQDLDEARAFPEKFVNALAAAGWLSALIPEEYGGSNLSLTEASVIDNVMIGFYRRERSSTLASLLGLPAARSETVSLRARALALLELFGMAHLAEHEAGGLAYGHQRRVEMMRALASEPALILLDEPVAGMNDVEAAELGEIFTRLAREGMGVLLIEHNVRFVTQLCHHIYVLDSGRMIASGTPTEVVNNPAVITAYLGA